MFHKLGLGGGSSVCFFFQFACLFVFTESTCTHSYWPGWPSFLVSLSLSGSTSKEKACVLETLWHRRRLYQKGYKSPKCQERWLPRYLIVLNSYYRTDFTLLCLYVLPPPNKPIKVIYIVHWFDISTGRIFMYASGCICYYRTSSSEFEHSLNIIIVVFIMQVRSINQSIN